MSGRERGRKVRLVDTHSRVSWGYIKYSMVDGEQEGKITAGRTIKGKSRMTQVLTSPVPVSSSFVSLSPFSAVEWKYGNIWPRKSARMVKSRIEWLIQWWFSGGQRQDLFGKTTFRVHSSNGQKAANETIFRDTNKIRHNTYISGIPPLYSLLVSQGTVLGFGQWTNGPILCVGAGNRGNELDNRKIQNSSRNDSFSHKNPFVLSLPGKNISIHPSSPLLPYSVPLLSHLTFITSCVNRRLFFLSPHHSMVLDSKGKNSTEIVFPFSLSPSVLLHEKSFQLILILRPFSGSDSCSISAPSHLMAQRQIELSFSAICWVSISKGGRDCIKVIVTGKS